MLRAVRLMAFVVLVSEICLWEDFERWGFLRLDRRLVPSLGSHVGERGLLRGLHRREGPL